MSKVKASELYDHIFNRYNQNSLSTDFFKIFYHVPKVFDINDRMQGTPPFINQWQYGGAFQNGKYGTCFCYFFIGYIKKNIFMPSCL